MTADARHVTAGRVGRPHGLDGSFHLARASEPLRVGAEVIVGDRPAVVERVAGTEERPIVRVSGVGDRDAVGDLRGAAVLIEAGELADGEYFAADLVGCEVAGLGAVTRVVHAPSCDLLEVGDDGLLVPFVSDAVTAVDLDARSIEVDRSFLGIEDAQP